MLGSSHQCGQKGTSFTNYSRCILQISAAIQPFSICSAVSRELRSVCSILNLPQCLEFPDTEGNKRDKTNMCCVETTATRLFPPVEQFSGNDETEIEANRNRSSLLKTNTIGSLKLKWYSILDPPPSVATAFLLGFACVLYLGYFSNAIYGHAALWWQ